MLLVYVHDTEKYGTLLGSALSRSAAIRLRALSGDLLCAETGEIDPSEDWLFDWEKTDPNCYARRKQGEGFSCKGYTFFTCPSERMTR